MDERSPIYNLKVVVSETGVKPETLRAWERRYGFPKPQRTPGGHRLYTLRDIRTINWLSERQREGLSISRAVELWKTLEQSGEDPLHSESLSHPFPASDRSNLELLRYEWVKACLKFNEISADKIITQAFAIAPPELVCVEILQKGLVDIGDKWFQGDATVQQEHFATSLAINRLHTLINAAPTATRDGTLLAVCPAGEAHEFGLLLFTYLLRRQGWGVVYLGANVPLLRLEAAIRTIKPVLTLSLAQSLPTASSLAELAEFLNNFGIPLAYGGAVFNAIPSLISYISGQYLGETIEGSTKTIEKILRSPKTPVSIQPRLPEYEMALKDYYTKRVFIEASVIQAVSEVGFVKEYSKQVREYMLDHLEAGLSFGDIELLGWPLVWLKDFVKSYIILDDGYPVIIKAFIQSIDLHMQENGKIITNYLRRELE